MRELNECDVERVHGGTNSVLGSVLIAGVAAVNGLQDAVAPLALAVTGLGGAGLAAAHKGADGLIYGVSRALVGFGQALGGSGTVSYHYVNEWG